MAPVISSRLQLRSLLEDDSVLQTSGRVTYLDDQPGVHSFSLSPDAAVTEFQGIFGRYSLSDAARNTQGGSVAWSYLADNAKLQSLSAGQVLSEQFDVFIKDSEGRLASQRVTVRLSGRNDAIEIVSEQQQALLVQGDTRNTAQGKILFVDADLSDVHVAKVSGTSRYGSFTLETLRENQGLDVAGEQGWRFVADPVKLATLAQGQSVVETFVVTLSDRKGSMVPVSVSIQFQGVNDQVVINSASQTGRVVEDATVSATGTVLFTDVDATDLHVAYLDQPGVREQQGQYGTFRLTTLIDPVTGKPGRLGWTYELEAGRTDFLARGETRTETFTLRISDQKGSEASKSVTVQIAGSNDLVTLLSTDADQMRQAFEDQGVYSTSGTVRFADLDLVDVHRALLKGSHPEGSFRLGKLVETVSTDAEGRQVKAGSVAWTFTADTQKVQALSEGQNLDLAYEISVTDGKGSTAVQRVVIRITGVNDQIVLTSADSSLSFIEINATEEAPAAPQGSSGQVTFTDVDLNDMHRASVAHVTEAVMDSSVSQAEPVQSVSGLYGRLSLVDGVVKNGAAGTQAWSYEVDALAVDALAQGEKAFETFTITIDDGQGSQKSQTIRVEITGTNDAPTLVADVATVAAGDSVLIDVLDNDSDIDGDVLTLVAATSEQGSVTIEDGRLRFEAREGFVGEATVTYQVSDSRATSSQNVTITVEAAPVVEPAPTVINASVDAVGNVMTLYYDQVLDASSLPLTSQFSVMSAGQSVAVTGVEVLGNQVVLQLAAVLAPSAMTTVAYQDLTSGDDAHAVQTRLAESFSFGPRAVTNQLSLTASGDTAFNAVSSLKLAGAEISAFDPVSGKLFVTSFAGLQIVQTLPAMALSLEKVVSFQTAFGSNDVNSVAVKDGLVAVALAANPKTEPGKVIFLDVKGQILGSVTVGALPDMLTFSPDGKTLLVANEAEISSDNTIDPVGSVSIIDLSGGVAQATVTTAGFEGFNDQLASLRDEGVRLFAGSPGFEGRSVAQDLEPEYIAVSADGRTAFVTLQENNAIGILDLVTREFTDIVALGLKSFKGLPVDTSDRDGVSNGTAINLQTDQPVFGQFMPDAVARFSAGGRTYFVIANEGDDRDDFLNPDETTRVGNAVYDLDNERFPNEASLKTNAELARLTVTQQSGLRGDVDGDGDVDQILMYGARSFSILDDQGRMIFDSGSHIEQFVAANGLFTTPTGSGLFDDTRSDNKGPEPEGVTIGQVGDRTLAFVGLERGGGGVMVYDVTDPADVEFVQYLRRPGDESPEGLTFVAGAESPSGKDLVIVTNEVSNTLTVYQNGAFTLQLLHFADAEAGLLASKTAPHLAALVDRFEDQFVNSITLAGGDNFLPGPFLAGGTDASLIPVLNAVTGGTLAATATVPIAAVDIAIHNLIGVEASTIGNHEFDLGSRVLSDAMNASGGYVGAAFPYMSANLDFSGDNDLRGRFVDTVTPAETPLASTLKGKIVPSAVLVEGGQKIGLLAATTQILEAISSPSGTEVKGFPTGVGANGERDDMDLLAQQLQPVIDDLRAQGINKIILMAHLQVLANEKLLATKLSGVDIILSAGSNTRLGDADDVPVDFPGHQANFADTYPLVIKDRDGGDTLLVNTDNEFTYLGRLVVDFDAEGRVMVDGVARHAPINGAVASTAENVARAWGVDTEELSSTAFATGTRGAQVKQLTDAVQSVIDSKDGNIYGYSNVYLEGERVFVRSEETNLGNLSADANSHVTRLALGDEAAYFVSLKNGGGIRAQIGTLSAPKADGTVDKLPPETAGEVSQLDVENALRFNNQLMAFDTTAAGLKAILEHGVAAGLLQGRFPQLGGVSFSFDLTQADGTPTPVGSRVKDIALVGDGYRVNLYDDGVLLPQVPGKITVTTLSFTANGGDSYPIKANAENFRYVQMDADGKISLSAPVDEALNFTTGAHVPATVLGEQKAFELYMKAVHGTPETAFDQADTPASLDTRIQNLDVRVEAVLDAEANETLISTIQGNGDASALVGQTVTVQARVTAVKPGLKTFWVEEELRDQDGLATTSEGVAVFYGDVAPVSLANIGDVVRFTAVVGESFGMTQLSAVSGLVVVSDGDAADLGQATVVTLPIADGTTLERFEGMRVEVSAQSGGDLFVSDTFTYARFGEFTLHADAVPFQFTETQAPSVTGNAAYQNFLLRNSIQIEDGSTQQNPTLAALNSGGMISRDTTVDGVDNATAMGVQADGSVSFIRAGDAVSSVTGVLGFGFGRYELQPTEAVKLQADPRPVAPEGLQDAQVKVASFNVLNYFTTLGTASFTTPTGEVHTGRGASNMTEFLQQQAKIVQAMLATDADVFALNELQNNGFGADSALASLVSALNAQVGSARFAFVSGHASGGDAIKVGIVYDTTVVKPLGSAVTPDVSVHDAFATSNRLPVAQTFGQVGDDSRQFTLVVNHLKSKGSAATQDAADQDQGDGQGLSAGTRLKATTQLAQWLAGNPTGATDGDYVLAGDLNSYSKETSIAALEASGYTLAKNAGDYSYLFDGLRGSLDHILTRGLEGEIVGVAHFNINADEQIALDYNDEFSPADLKALDRDDAYRSSDHDPVVIGLRLNAEAGSPAPAPAPQEPEPMPEPTPEAPVTPVTPEQPPAPVLVTPFISEFHYDNSGADMGEAIAIQGSAGTNLDGWSLVLYNGNSPSAAVVYGSALSLNGLVIDNEQGGMGEVFVAATGLQNGANDAIALLDAQGNVVQFISYEGVTTASGGPASGLTSRDVGVSETGTEAAGGSIQFVEGAWRLSGDDSFGFLNAVPVNGL